MVGFPQPDKPFYFRWKEIEYLPAFERAGGFISFCVDDEERVADTRQFIPDHFHQLKRLMNGG
jgi:hypothetical protein